MTHNPDITIASLCLAGLFISSLAEAMIIHKRWKNSENNRRVIRFSVIMAWNLPLLFLPSVTPIWIYLSFATGFGTSGAVVFVQSFIQDRAQLKKERAEIAKKLTEETIRWKVFLEQMETGASSVEA